MKLGKHAENSLGSLVWVETGMNYIPVGKYLVFYMPINGGIEIVRVLHGMMDIDTFFISG
jgi:hypothetical protein